MRLFLFPAILIAASVNVDACLFITRARIFLAVFRSHIYPRLAARMLINGGIVILSARRSAEAAGELGRLSGRGEPLLWDPRLVQDEDYSVERERERDVA